MFKNDEIRSLWSKTKPKVWEGHYWMVSFSLESADVVTDIVLKALTDNSYYSMIRDQHEIAFIVHESIWEYHKTEHNHQTEFGPLAGITFDVPLDIEVSGYLAPMVDGMAKNGISIVPQCSLIYDHIFVKARDLSAAILIIKGIQVRAMGKEA